MGPPVRAMPFRFRSSTAAVSHILGVVLIIAIAIALAIGLAVMADKFSDQATDSEPPVLGFERVDGDTIRIAQAPPDLPWSHLLMSGSCAPTLNGAAYPPPGGTLVKAGDLLSCGSATTLTISSTEGHGNAVLYRTQFE